MSQSSPNPYLRKMTDAPLAFLDPQLLVQAKPAILIVSFIAGSGGYLFLRFSRSSVPE